MLEFQTQIDTSQNTLRYETSILRLCHYLQMELRMAIESPLLLAVEAIQKVR